MKDIDMMPVSGQSCHIIIIHIWVVSLKNAKCNILFLICMS